MMEEKNKNSQPVKKFFRGQWLLKFFGRRQTKYGSNTLLAVIALLGILILLNYIAQKEVVRWDLTKVKQYTLSDQTKKVLKNVNEEVKIIGFFQGGDSSQEETEDLLTEYSNLNGKIKVEFIDPDVKPMVAKEYGITRYGTLVFEKGDKREQALTTAESDITSGILKLTRAAQKKIYFLTGHNEKDIKSQQEDGYGIVGELLEKEGYSVENLSLIATRAIPSEAAVLVIAGPQKKILDEEKEVISQYLNNGGKLLVLLDPLKDSSSQKTNLEDLLVKWGVQVEEGVVVDPKKYFWTDVGTPVIEEWTTHQITDNLSPAFFPGVKLVGEAKEHPQEVTIEPLAKTSADSWLEKDLKASKTKFEEKVDVRGPIAIAMVVQGVDNAAVVGGEENSPSSPATKMRLVAIGDSDFANNIFAESLGNLDLLVNSVDWLAEEEELISIRPKQDEQRIVTLTGKQTQLIFYTTVLGMPLVVVIIGIGVWLDRRKRKKQA